MTTQPPSSQSNWPHRWVNLALVMALTALAGIAILPAYLGGPWPWDNLSQVAQIDQLHQLQATGLELPGWQLTSAEPIAINKQAWNLGEYRAETPPGQGASVQQFALLLHPQPWHSNQPQLEWIDLTGAQNWRIESRQRLRVGPSAGAGPVNARFFQARDDRQSLAVVQWYAMPKFGHSSPSHWFWADQWSQLTQHRLTPWVAVSVLIPMQPLGAIDAYQPLATELTNLIQAQLTATVFH